MNIITLFILIIILGIIIFVHEFGHFLAAKKSKVYVEEFALGMGPKIYSFKRKNDNTTYSIRLFPVGGFVSMANSEGEGIKAKRGEYLEEKTFIQKLLVFVMGILLNFILTIILLFLSGLIYGSPNLKPVVGEVKQDTPAFDAGLTQGDIIIEVEDSKVSSWDDVLIILNKDKDLEKYSFKIKNDEGEIKNISITPTIEEIDGSKVKIFGISSEVNKSHGFIDALKYSINGFTNMFKTILIILGNLFTGNIELKNISGPIGIYSLIDDVKASGLESLIYLTAYLSMNVAIINLIPLPIFDGGRILLVTIEKIINKKLSPKVENILNMIGVIMLIILTLYVTFNDILKLF